MLTFGHFVASFSLALLSVLLGSYLTSTMPTPHSRDGPTRDGYTTLSHLIRVSLYYSASSGAFVVVEGLNDGGKGFPVYEGFYLGESVA